MSRLALWPRPPRRRKAAKHSWSSSDCGQRYGQTRASPPAVLREGPPRSWKVRWWQGTTLPARSSAAVVFRPGTAVSWTSAFACAGEGGRATAARDPRSCGSSPAWIGTRARGEENDAAVAAGFAGVGRYASRVALMLLGAALTRETGRRTSLQKSSPFTRSLATGANSATSVGVHDGRPCRRRIAVVESQHRSRSRRPRCRGVSQHRADDRAQPRAARGARMGGSPVAVPSRCEPRPSRRSR